jgi:acetyl esterase/lipase
LLRDTRVSPLHGARWLPPTLIICGGRDPLLEDSRALQQQLEQAGVRHELVVASGMPHGFMQMEFFAESRRCMGLTQRFLATELARSKRSDARRFAMRISRGLRRVFS